MSNYQQSMTIPAPAEQIFAFVSDVTNLPKYLPTTKSAQKQSEDRVRVQGEVKNERYDSDGYLRPDRDAMHMEWGADEGYYSGKMQLNPQGNNATEVTVQLMFREKPEKDGEAPSDEQINDGIRRALESIQNHVTGQGGKNEAPVTNQA